MRRPGLRYARRGAYRVSRRLNRRVKSAAPRKVGAHWPTNSPSSRLPRACSAAEARIEPAEAAAYVQLITAVGRLVWMPRWPSSRARMPARSEEHTSELQSRRDLVCRLLLEKKKKKK